MVSWFTLLVSRLYCYNTTDLHNITDTIAECPFKNWFTKQVHYVKPICRILYCFDSHTMWYRSAYYCTVTTDAWCETIAQIFVLSRLKHYVKPLGRICYCPDSHTNVKSFWRLFYWHDSHVMWNRWADYCIVVTHILFETVVQIIVLLRPTHNVKPLGI